MVETGVSNVYYGVGYAFTDNITIGDNITATIMSGSLSVTDGTNTVSLKDIATETAVTVSIETDAMKIAGGVANMTGEISMTAGTATIDSSDATTLASALNGLLSETTFGATTVDLSTAAATAYGNVALSGEITLGTNKFTIAAGATFDGTLVAKDGDSNVVGEISGTITPSVAIDITAINNFGADSNETAVNIANAATISGSYSVDGNINLAGAVVIPNGSEMRIVDTTTVVKTTGLTVLGTVSGPAAGQIDGTVNAKNANAVKPYVKSGTTGPVADITLTDVNSLIDALNAGYDVEISITSAGSGDNEFTVAEFTDALTKDVLMNGNKLTINVADGQNLVIIIRTGTTWEMVNESVVDLNVAESGNGLFKLNNRASLIIDNSNLGMPVDVGNGITDVSGDVVTIDNATGDVTVGFGREYVLTRKIATANIDVIGDLTISGDLSQNSNIVVMQGGSVTVDDRFTVLGTVTVNVGGTFTIAEGGAMTVGNNSGAASLTINTAAVGADDEGQFVIAEGGSLTIASNSSNSPPNNLIIATTGTFNGAASTGVVNNGTLTMNGSMTGALKNNGTMTFNGVAVGATTVYLMENKSLNVSSVTGTLNVSDAGVLDHYSLNKANVKDSDGNVITLTNVRSVNIASEVVSKSYNGTRYWAASMDVSGTIASSTAKDDSSVILTSAAMPEGFTADRMGNIAISEATTIGQYVDLTFAGREIAVEATVTAVSENTVITANANVVVTGSIVIGGNYSGAKEVVNETNLSAAKYTLTTAEPAAETVYYTSFDAALTVIADADQDTIEVFGKATAETTATIPANTFVVIEGTLVIDKDVTITAANGSEVSGNVIDVNGTFVAEYYANDIDMEDILADVIRIDGEEYTFTSLANALADAGEGDVIQLSAEEVVIDADTEIPAGVTVKSDGSKIVINHDVTLTVAGTLDVINAEVVSGAVSGDEKAGNIVVSGTSMIAADQVPAIYENVAGAHYSKTTNRTVYYVSSVAIAATNADQYLDSYSDGCQIHIIGQVTAGEVTFTKTADMDALVIGIDAMAGANNNTSVSFTKLTLDGAKLVIDVTGTSNIVSVSGDVAAMTGTEGSEAESVIGLAGASSLAIESFTDDSPEVPVSYLLINGTANENAFGGNVEVSTGTVTVGTVNNSGALAAGTVTAAGDSVLTVAQNATLVVGFDKAPTSTVNANKGTKDKTTLVVDGTVSVGENGTVNIAGIADINGTVTVADSENTEGVRVTGTLNVNGTLQVSAVEGEAGYANVDGVVYVAAQAVVSGPVNIATSTSSGLNYIVAYTGADLSAAQINWVNGASTAESTQLTINGEPYMTVYSYGNFDVPLTDVMVNAEIEIPGLATPTYDADTANQNGPFKLYSDADCKQQIKSAVNVGDYDAIYTKFDAAVVYGTVSEGVGFTLFIDGVPAYLAPAGEYELTVGTHTVSYDVEVGYSGANASLTFNGQAIQSGATIEITADMDSFTIAVTGASPADLGAGSSVYSDGSDGGEDDRVLIREVLDHIGSDGETVGDGLSVEGDGHGSGESGIHSRGDCVGSDCECDLVTGVDPDTVDEQRDLATGGVLDVSRGQRGLGVDSTVLSDGDGTDVVCDVGTVSGGPGDCSSLAGVDSGEVADNTVVDDVVLDSRGARIDCGEQSVVDVERRGVELGIIGQLGTGHVGSGIRDDMVGGSGESDDSDNGSRGSEGLLNVSKSDSVACDVEVAFVILGCRDVDCSVDDEDGCIDGSVSRDVRGSVDDRVAGCEGDLTLVDFECSIDGELHIGSADSELPVLANQESGSGGYSELRLLSSGHGPVDDDGPRLDGHGAADIVDGVGVHCDARSVDILLVLNHDVGLVDGDGSVGGCISLAVESGDSGCEFGTCGVGINGRTGQGDVAQGDLGIGIENESDSIEDEVCSVGHGSVDVDCSDLILRGIGYSTGDGCDHDAAGVGIGIAGTVVDKVGIDAADDGLSIGCQREVAVSDEVTLGQVQGSVDGDLRIRPGHVDGSADECGLVGDSQVSVDGDAVSHGDLDSLGDGERLLRCRGTDGGGFDGDLVSGLGLGDGDGDSGVGDGPILGSGHDIVVLRGDGGDDIRLDHHLSVYLVDGSLKGSPVLDSQDGVLGDGSQDVERQELSVGDRDIDVKVVDISCHALIVDVLDLSHGGGQGRVVCRGHGLVVLAGRVDAVLGADVAVDCSAVVSVGNHYGSLNDHVVNVGGNVLVNVEGLARCDIDVFADVPGISCDSKDGYGSGFDGLVSQVEVSADVGPEVVVGGGSVLAGHGDLLDVDGVTGDVAGSTCGACDSHALAGGRIIANELADGGGYADVLSNGSVDGDGRSLGKGDGCGCGNSGSLNDIHISIEHDFGVLHHLYGDCRGVITEDDQIDFLGCGEVAGDDGAIDGQVVGFGTGCRSDISCDGQPLGLVDSEADAGDTLHADALFVGFLCVGDLDGEHLFDGSVVLDGPLISDCDFLALGSCSVDGSPVVDDEGSIDDELSAVQTEVPGDGECRSRGNSEGATCFDDGIADGGTVVGLSGDLEVLRVRGSDVGVLCVVGKGDVAAIVSTGADLSAQSSAVSDCFFTVQRSEEFDVAVILCNVVDVDVHVAVDRVGRACGERQRDSLGSFEDLGIAHGCLLHNVAIYGGSLDCDSGVSYGGEDLGGVVVVVGSIAQLYEVFESLGR